MYQLRDVQVDAIDVLTQGAQRILLRLASLGINIAP
jgi:hypothetical protein